VIEVLRFASTPRTFRSKTLVSSVLYANIPLHMATNVDIKKSKNDNALGLLRKRYELSLTFPSLEESQELHKKWKKKNDPVNVLAFPLDDSEGEIFITLSKARTEASKYGRTYREHLLFLFIHACLHLKGYNHGDIMERRESHYMKKFTPAMSS
jgi:rRNA maturation RNase YbeY